MKRVAQLALALIVSTTAPLAAQQDTPLRPGEARTGTLASDARHTYVLDLSDSTYVFGHVNQISVDVVVTVLGPDGDEVAEFDDPARGPELFSFTSADAGRYVIAITPFEEQEGDYEVLLRKSEPIAREPGARIDQIMTPYSGRDTPGAVVGVLDRGEVVFERAYGMADLSFGIEHQVGTPTNIGSVTKQFTAMAILLLQNDGLVSLDDDVRKHIPELPDFGPDVTLKNLLNHTGGYRELYNFLPMEGRDGQDAIRREEAIRIVQRQPELQDPPNTVFNYNNTGFILLSMVVERVSGKTFPEFMQERVFGPLGMTHTRVKHDQGEIIPGSSTPYIPAEEGGWLAARDLGASAGAGGIYTTLHDMTKWMLNYRDAKVGGPKAIELLTTRNVLANGDTSTYALGLGVAERRGTTVYTHTGGDVAHRTFFSYYPELQAGLFLSSNNATFGASYASIPEIEELFFGDRLEPRESDDEEETPSGSMPLERMEAIVGDWILGSGLVITFKVEDGGLIGEPRGQGPQRLTATSDSTLAIETLSVSIVFHFQPDGSVDRATFTQSGSTSPMVPYEEEPIDAEALAELAGHYYGEELELWLELRVEEGELVLHRLRAEPITLRHRSGSKFSGAFPFVEVELVRAANGSITGLLAGNGRTKGVLFERRR